MQHCRVALEALENARAELLAGQGQVRGKVRISASTDFGRHLLSQWLEELSAGHPQLHWH